ncbi:hypothetical protein Focb16_v000246 [Fusarium oxysporum f. sp. cubense]|uniref:Uncharacterized protein n=1 Tax=Fusarium oxysporum f. sp. cubense TaxID=61366 RepID=A0A559L7R0_FUSOC|nr:hypothetical protein Focb16_v000246 [Fusarium oxysporum f. sp. cubense]
MPLYLPNPGSTAVASYISAVADLSIFSNEAETQKLAKEIIASMRSENWWPSAGLAIQYERPVTPAEGFVPIQIVADKLTHLGQLWKPLTVSNGHKWPPVISAEDARKLRWESYDQIGQPSQDN